eukprot:40555-Chlamydomonas_euryale.AAC.5
MLREVASQRNLPSPRPSHVAHARRRRISPSLGIKRSRAAALACIQPRVRTSLAKYESTVGL